MAGLALVLYMAGLGVVFGVRTWLQIRRTGRSGFNGISGTPGSPQWFAGVLFVAALVLGLAAVAGAATGIVTAPTHSFTATAGVVGLVVAVGGIVGVMLAQGGMGASWRIGVDNTERTELVTDGVFAVVRNPIFTAMVVTQVGFVVLAPTWLSLLALACLVVAVQLQVRLLEEPHLVAVHGAAYLDYAARTGRFVPGIGHRLRAAESTPVTVTR